MKHQRIAAIGIDQTIFRAAPKAGDPSTGQALPQIDRKCAAKVRTTRFDTRDAAAFEHARQAADGGLDFGQLRHASRYGERLPSPLEARAA